MTEIDRIVETLATYFSGSNVVCASVCLEAGGPAKMLAGPYFEMREALGIKGYATRDEAIQSVRAALIEREPHS